MVSLRLNSGLSYWLSNTHTAVQQMRSWRLNSGLSYCPIHTPLYTEQERWCQNDGLTELLTVQDTRHSTTRQEIMRATEKVTVWVTAQYTRRSTTDEIMAAKWRFELRSNTHTALQQKRSWGQNDGLSQLLSGAVLLQQKEMGATPVWVTVRDTRGSSTQEMEGQCPVLAPSVCCSQMVWGCVCATCACV